MNWFRLAYAAATLALDEWRESRANAAAVRAHTNNPRSGIFVTCEGCGQRVRADLASLAEHRCP
jgi:hypothetical protein